MRHWSLGVVTFGHHITLSVNDNLRKINTLSLEGVEGLDLTKVGFES